MNWLSDDTIDRLRQVTGVNDPGLDRYHVIETLGEGGMGTVYLAEDKELSREVALKVLRDTVGTPDAVERMLREARIIAGLEHPGVVPVHDVGCLPDGRVYYVMKRVRGRSLDQHVGAESTLADRLRIFERVCETVAFAHAHGVIHRDLKPHNVMIGEFGEVLVLDWGVAKLLKEPSPAAAEPPSPVEPAAVHSEDVESDPQRTQTIFTKNGVVVGTPSYMSPEQALGHVDRVDQRSDVFALGAILYTLLAGRPPLDRAEFARLRRDGVLRIEPVRRHDAGIPRPLEAICMKALAAEPGDRYDSAAALRADIASHLGGRPVTAYREGPLERVGRFVYKYRAPILLVVAYLVMRLMLLVYQLYKGS